MTGRANHKIRLILTFFVLLVLTSAQAQAAYGGGSGTAEDPYLIYTPEQMDAIGANYPDWDKHFKLMADINLGDFNGTSFNIIGTGWSNTFTGVFDGNNHTISNFTYHTEENNFIGMFGHVEGETAEIKNLTLANPDVNNLSAYRVGSLVGRLEGGKVTNCSVEQGTVIGNGYIGGLVGENDSGEVSNCRAVSTTVTGSNYTGTIVGGVYYGTVANCSVEQGIVYGILDDLNYTAFAVGGLVGANWFGSIADCHSVATVSSEGNCTGGLVGMSQDGTITGCSSTGSISGDDSVGGLLGHLHSGEVLDCDSDANVIGGIGVGGLLGDMVTSPTMEPALITRCSASGDVLGYDFDAGGLVGYNVWAITNSYATGNVSGNLNVGGLAGRNAVETYYDFNDIPYASNPVISKCYSTGQVSGTHYTGGLVGRSMGGVEIHSFWDIETSGKTTSSGGGTGLTTAEMQTKSTFTSEDWNFTKPVWWIIDHQDYPHLSRQWDANQIYVPQEFTEIQTAVNISKDGDTVIVAPGTYTGDGNRDIDFLGKAVTVRSEIGPQSTIIDCNGSPNEPHRGFYFHSGENNDSLLEGFTITNAYASYGAGICCDDSSPTIASCVITNNSADVSSGEGGGMYNYYSSPAVTNCIFSGNSAGAYGAGMCNLVSSPIVKNSAFCNNTTQGTGGGSFNYYDSNATFQNCTFTENSADIGGAMFIYDSNIVITSCILWNNTTSPEIYLDTAAPTVTYSDVKGGWTGPGNIDADPCFVNPDSNDFHLLPDSPCINIGDPNFLPEPNETDIDAEVRIIQGRIDMGADEFNPFRIYGDITGDGIVDFYDLAILFNQWLLPPGVPSADITPFPAGDGIVNLLDFARLADNWLKTIPE